MRALPFGMGFLDLPASLSEAELLAPAEPPALPDPALAVAGALARPLGSRALDAFVEPGDRVAVVVPDATRRMPLGSVLPAVVAALREAGASGIELRIANGTHRRATEGERAAIRKACGLEPGDRDAGDPSAHEAVGRTSAGVARLDAAVARADKVVLVGPISFHYLAGFGGGGKLLAPGCADRATAIAIHRTCLDERGRHPLAAMGQLSGNPLHAAIDEVRLLSPPCFLVQVALTRQGRLAAVFAGEVRAAHAAAAGFALRWNAVACEPADLVVVSAGGAPHDMNLYQAHKALEAAAHAVRPGGAVVLVAACPEGAGGPAFAASLAHPGADAHEAALRREFSIASHTALALRRKTEALRCAAVAPGLPGELLSGLGLRPCADLDEALAAVGGVHGRTLLIPDGARTLPLARGALLPAAAAAF